MTTIAYCCLCPGFHDPALTRSFLNQHHHWLPPTWDDRCWVYPSHQQPPYSPHHVAQWLQHHHQTIPQTTTPPPLVWISFSAGIVGSLAVARQCHRQGQPILGFFALDGWGVPLWADFPLYSLSHDRFSHDTSAILRSGPGPHFYSDPPVSHLDLWVKPHRVWGWRLSAHCPPHRLTAAQFIHDRLRVWGN